MWDVEEKHATLVLARVGTPVLDLLQRGVVHVAKAVAWDVNDDYAGMLLLVLHEGTYLIEDVVPFPFSDDGRELTSNVLAQE